MQKYGERGQSLQALFRFDLKSFIGHSAYAPASNRDVIGKGRLSSIYIERNTARDKHTKSDREIEDGVSE
ncbi:hypothetical protein D3C84_906360 [compost metagenome]